MTFSGDTAKWSQTYGNRIKKTLFQCVRIHFLSIWLVIRFSMKCNLVTPCKPCNSLCFNELLLLLLLYLCSCYCVPWWIDTYKIYIKIHLLMAEGNFFFWFVLLYFVCIVPFCLLKNWKTYEIFWVCSTLHVRGKIQTQKYTFEKVLLSCDGLRFQSIHINF